jgi:hypothetical protein
MHVLHTLTEEAGLGRDCEGEGSRGGGVGDGGVGDGDFTGDQLVPAAAGDDDVAGEKGCGAIVDAGGFFNVIVIVGMRVWFRHCDENTEASDEHVADGTEGAHVNAVAVRGSKVRRSVDIISNCCAFLFPFPSFQSCSNERGRYVKGNFRKDLQRLGSGEVLILLKKNIHAPKASSLSIK